MIVENERSIFSHYDDLEFQEGEDKDTFTVSRPSNLGNAMDRRTSVRNRQAHEQLKNYLIENSRFYEIKNKNEISKLRYEIRENCKLLQELSLGTPIIAQIKAKIDHVEVLQSSQ